MNDVDEDVEQGNKGSLDMKRGRGHKEGDNVKRESKHLC